MVVRKRSRPISNFLSAQVGPLIQLWLLRLLVPLGVQKEYITRHGFCSDTLSEAIGLNAHIDLEADIDPGKARQAVRKLHAEAEIRCKDAKAPDCLTRNIERLANLVGLSEVDCRILEFAVLINNERLLDDTADWLETLSTTKVYHVLSVLLDKPVADIKQALNMDGVLVKSGLVNLDRHGTAHLRSKLQLLSDSFSDRILSSDSDPINLLKDTIVPSKKPTLQLDDYGHIQETLTVLRAYLAHSVTTARPGVNIFIHGSPGTGKTQLARVLAQELGCELFEVASEDSDGDPIGGLDRLRAYRAAQCFLGQRGALILFDEVEDVFNGDEFPFDRQHSAHARKAWINRALEENPIPTIWLSNSIRRLDPAYVRRYDMLFELPIPPKKQRARILTQACGNLLDARSIARIAESERLAPAVVTKASAVVQSIRGEIGEQRAGQALELLINNTLQAQQHKPIKRDDSSRLSEIYDPAFIHADSDLASVAAGLVQAKFGRLCLYGPPGTGKTAFGRWLAEQLQMPLLVKRASDLLSMYVGGSEKNIAAAFRQAEQEGAVLLIDEIDSFLQDRRGAVRSWEVTEVNEMLTQMESFSGIFIASTNLVEGLDQAALRRFDLKVKLDCLRPEQAWELLLRHCDSLGLPLPSEALQFRLHGLRSLTPGDFAAVVRQHRFRPFTSASHLVAALESDCGLKQGGRGPIGFL